MVRGRAVERLLRARMADSTKARGISGMELVRQFIREEDGQDVVEYGLLIATIAIVVLVGISFFGNNIQAWFQSLAGRITTTGT
jgi:Flp pilus assembly pilin Flp